MFQFNQNSISRLIDVFIQNSNSPTGAGLTGLAYNTSGLTAYYHATTGSASTAISLATMTLGTWASGGFVQVDAINMPGVYQLGIPNSLLAFATGGGTIVLQGATNMVPCVIPIQILPVGVASNVIQWNGNNVSSAINGIPDVNPTYWKGNSIATAAQAGVPDVNVKNINNIGTTSVTSINAIQGTAQPLNFTGTGSSAYVQGDVKDWNGSAVVTPNVAGVPIIDLKYTLGTLSAGAAGYMGIDWSKINAPASTQNLSGTSISIAQQIASVSGAVGSVTGNVGGNVAGSVASVTTGVTVTINNDKAGYAISQASRQAILTEPMDGVESSATAKCLAWLLAMVLNTKSLSAGTVTVKKADDATSYFSQSVTQTTGASPVTATGHAS